MKNTKEVTFLLIFVNVISYTYSMHDSFLKSVYHPI